MSHYLAYVYGPANKETLDRVMKPYNQDYHCPETGGMPPELVVLTNVPVLTLETSIFDMIQEFRKVSNKKSSFSKYRPIILVDDAYDYLDVAAVRELDAFVISYDLDSNKATAKIVVSRTFWDWWVIGGRWPIQFEGKSHMAPYMTNAIGPAEVSWAVDKDELAKREKGRFTSLRIDEINWKNAKQERVKNALVMWEVLHKADPTLEREGEILKRMNLPKGARYYSFDHEEYDAWIAKVWAIASAAMPNCMEQMFSPYSVAGMTRRELIRYAIARTYVPAFGIFYDEGYSEKDGVVFSQTAVYDWSFSWHPTDKEVKEVWQRVRQLVKLKPFTIVTAVDIHN
jgi:hypothetical protein